MFSQKNETMNNVYLFRMDQYMLSSLDGILHRSSLSWSNIHQDR